MARAKWHFGDGPSYCGACVDHDLPCAKGKENEHGEKCPYCTSEPQTEEGWQAWDLILRCCTQLRMRDAFIVGIDMGAALMTADALGYDRKAMAELLPACEAGLVAAMNEKIKANMSAS